jgi:hypothetical protein
MIGISGTVPINGGRGRATLQCVWSIHRIDAQLGRYLDINSAWRDPQEQEKLYQAYRNYQNGTGPWAPIALRPEQSVHCDGEAIDTDDNNAGMTRILNNNGWFHTVYHWVNGVYTLVEPWHYEYDYRKDKFFGGIPAGSGSTPIEEDDMFSDDDRRKMNAIYDAIFNGGPSMEDANRSISRSLALIQKNVSDITRDGKTLSLRQEVADAKTLGIAANQKLDAIRAEDPKA